MKYLPKNGVNCAACGILLFRWTHQIKKQRSFFCSKSCESKVKRGRVPHQLIPYTHQKGVRAWNKGLKATSEQKKKMSESRLRYFREHPEAKVKVSTLLTGRKQSLETIEKRVVHFRGKKRPEWVRRKIASKIRRGERSHFWRGGVSPVRKLLRQSLSYRIWREKVFTRDDYTCQSCFRRGFSLEADHKIAFSALVESVRKRNPEDLFSACLEEPRLWDVENGRTLCVACHKQTETYAKNTAYQQPV